MAFDDYIRFSKAAKLAPGTVSPCSVGRWARKGVRGVRLQYRQVGGVKYTSEKWLEEFFEAVAKAEVAPRGRNIQPCPTAYPIVDHETAERELEEAGC